MLMLPSAVVTRVVRFVSPVALAVMSPSAEVRSDCNVVTSELRLVIVPSADVTRVVSPLIAVLFVLMFVSAVSSSDCRVVMSEA